MSARADALAEKLDAAHGDLSAAIESATPDDWRATCTDGEWTKGYAAYHAAASIAGICGMARTLVEGNGPPPGTAASWDEINAMNAEHAKEHAACTPGEAMELLRADGPGAVAFLRDLSDEQLDRKVPPLLPEMPELSVEQFAEMVMIGHVTGHVQTITGAG